MAGKREQSEPRMTLAKWLFSKNIAAAFHSSHFFQIITINTTQPLKQGCHLPVLLFKLVLFSWEVSTIALYSSFWIVFKCPNE